MADGRMLKKEIANSKKLAMVSETAAVVWFMMLPHTDQEGRLKACPLIVKGQYLTMMRYTEKAIQSAMEELHRAGLIILYRNNGDQFAEFTRFNDFQKINRDRESKSKIPAPTPEDSGVTPENSLLSLSLNEVKLSKDKRSIRPNPADLEKFDLFWKEYPRKVGKESAREKWRKIDFSNITPEKIIEQVKLLKTTEWKATESKFIPHASTWLYNKRYFDEVESGKKMQLNENKNCVACEKPATMKIGGTWYCPSCYGKGL